MENKKLESSIIQNISDFVVFEGMTAISALILALDNGKSSRKIHKILFDKSKTTAKHRELSFLRHKSTEHGFNINVVDNVEIDKYASGHTHGGVIALCSDVSIPSLSPEKLKPDGIYYMVEGVEDPYNFGYVIRSIYASGADGIVISPRNWFTATSVVTKSSAGTSELIDVYVADSSLAVDTFKSLGYSVVCAGIRDSKSIYEAELKKPLFVIIGGEKRGISRAILDKADEIVRIDYGRNFKGSLPSVAATSIISFEILRKNSNFN